MTGTVETTEHDATPVVPAKPVPWPGDIVFGHCCRQMVEEFASAEAAVRNFVLWFETAAPSQMGVTTQQFRGVIEGLKTDWMRSQSNARFAASENSGPVAGDIVAAVRHLAPPAAGELINQGGVWYALIDPRVNPAWRPHIETYIRIILAHEVGHVIVGAAHSSQVPSPRVVDGGQEPRPLMSTIGNTSGFITQRDAGRALSRWGRYNPPLPRPEPPPEFPEGIRVERGEVITPHKRFTAFDGYSGPLAVTAADVLRNGMTEVIVASTGSNRNNQIRVFHGRWIERDVGQPLLLGWHPFGAYRGGVRIAYGELSGGARRFVVAQASSPGRVRTFGPGGNPVHEWVAFPEGATALDVRENSVLVFRGSEVKQYTVTGQLMQEWR